LCAALWLRSSTDLDEAGGASRSLQGQDLKAHDPRTEPFAVTSSLGLCASFIGGADSRPRAMKSGRNGVRQACRRHV
jgi:hypothetical protein